MLFDHFSALLFGLLNTEQLFLATLKPLLYVATAKLSYANLSMGVQDSLKADRLEERENKKILGFSFFQTCLFTMETLYYLG